MTVVSARKLRLATVWLGGCSGCHMSLLDLDERLMELQTKVDLVYGPLVDAKEFPREVDVTLVEGAVANVDHLELLETIRGHSAILVSLGDCAVTGNVTALRNGGKVSDLLTTIYRAGPGRSPVGPEAVQALPALLPKVLPLHHVVDVDAFIPGCPPDSERIWAALGALLRGEPVALEENQRTFG
ncbi:MAG: NADP oxidoreductase [Desulfuromonas sp.]|nr:NADP oxidoreductase [Desulfuromonas sp.]